MLHAVSGAEFNVCYLPWGHGQILVLVRQTADVARAGIFGIFLEIFNLTLPTLPYQNGNFDDHYGQ